MPKCAKFDLRLCADESPANHVLRLHEIIRADAGKKTIKRVARSAV